MGVVDVGVLVLCTVVGGLVMLGRVVRAHPESSR